MTFNKENFQKWMDVARDPNTKQAFGSLREVIHNLGNNQDEYCYCFYGCAYRAAELTGINDVWDNPFCINEFVGVGMGLISTNFYKHYETFISTANDNYKIPLPKLANMLELAFKDYL